MSASTEHPNKLRGRKLTFASCWRLNHALNVLATVCTNGYTYSIGFLSVIMYCCKIVSANMKIKIVYVLLQGLREIQGISDQPVSSEFRDFYA
jgi:hypothetical protein